MAWIYLEAALALAVAVGIVWWTMGARRKDVRKHDDGAPR